MQTFSTALLPPIWQIYASAPAQVRHILQQSKRTLGSGAFSFVIEIDDDTVLKLSTCEASRVLLPQLKDNPVPGLPLVYKVFGQVGEVEAHPGYYNALPIHAYLMERLWTSRALEEKQLRTDYCPRGDQMRARSVPDAIGAYRWLCSTLSESDAWDLEKDAVVDSVEKTHPLVSAAQALLKNTRFQPLIGVIRRLSHRVKKKEWTFDFVDRHHCNILISRWGEPILADPVYDIRQPIWESPFWPDNDYDY